jgi:hypothetical protein
MEAGPASSFVFPLADPRFLDSTPPTLLHALTFYLLWRYRLSVSVCFQPKDVVRYFLIQLHIAVMGA